MKRVNIGLIGYGYMGKTHTMGYLNLPIYYDLQDIEINLYGACSSSLKEENNRFGYRIYDNYRDLIRDPNIDVIDICSPNFTHRDILIEAIKENKHIYCEKPLTLNYKEALEIQELLGTVNYTGINRIVFEYRFIPAIMKAKRLIEEGAVGKIIHFNIKYYGCEFLNPNRPISWQSTKEKSGGGVLYALGSHAIDLIHYLIGSIKGVYANKRTHYRERKVLGEKDKTQRVDTEDIINANLILEGDILGNLMLSQVAAGSTIDLQFEIYGEKGSIKFDHENPNIVRYYSFDKERDLSSLDESDGFMDIQTSQKYGMGSVFPPPRVNISWLRYHMASQYDFIRAIIDNRQSQPNLLDGYRVQKVMDKVLESALLNQFLEIHWDKE